MAEQKNRSRILILSHIAQFSLQRRIGDHIYGGLSDMAFLGGAALSPDVMPGDLVAIQSAPASKWYLGWLLERKQPPGYACEVYTIESIEDGQHCDWSNVGLIYYDRSQTRAHPEWRWADAQHKFSDRWQRACRKIRGAYIHLPFGPTFDGDAVELGVRVRHGLSEAVIRKSFPNWRKVTIKTMLEFYDAASAELTAERSVKVA